MEYTITVDAGQVKLIGELLAKFGVESVGELFQLGLEKLSQPVVEEKPAKSDKK